MTYITDDVFWKDWLNDNPENLFDIKHENHPEIVISLINYWNVLGLTNTNVLDINIYKLYQRFSLLNYDPIDFVEHMQTLIKSRLDILLHSSKSHEAYFNEDGFPAQKTKLERSQSCNNFPESFCLYHGKRTWYCDLTDCTITTNHRSFNSIENLSGYQSDFDNSKKVDLHTVAFCKFLFSQTPTLAGHIILTGPSAIPQRYREIYIKLMSITSKCLGRTKNYRLLKESIQAFREFHFQWMPDVQCTICCNDVGSLQSSCCGENICEKCLRKYINHKIKSQSNIQIECFQCTKILPFNIVWDYLSEPNRVIFNAIRQLTLETNSKKRCPYCLEFNEITPNELESINKRKYRKGLNIDCVRCGMSWCFKCQSPVHSTSTTSTSMMGGMFTRRSSITCKQNISHDKLFRSWMKKHNTKNERNAKKCPKCKTITQKIDGCQHISCTVCKSDWCFTCGNFMKTDSCFSHSHKYAFWGCNSLLYPDKPHLRRLIRLGVLIGSVLAAVPLATIGIVVCLVGVCYLPLKYYRNRLRR